MKNSYYFVKNEQIAKGEKVMIIMNIKVDNLYAFKNFSVNMSYPKKIVGSMIEEEFLRDRPNFRYKKVNIIMGGNATGKTSLGKLLMIFANYFTDGGTERFFKVVDDTEKEAFLEIDFVTDESILHRFQLKISKKEQEKYSLEDAKINIYSVEIQKDDNYERCVERLEKEECISESYSEIDTSGWYFAYPLDVSKNKVYYSIENDRRYIYILEHILKTLDPSIKEVIKVKEIENTYAIKWKHRSVIIKDGHIEDASVLSSGTKAGLDISYTIASLICNQHDLYYCDELFSYVNSDVEKACLSILIGKLKNKKQLFFTTHNTEILDMQLPKHSFTFLKKDIYNTEEPIKCVYASEYLKRNTDSLKHAVENDLFSTAPDLRQLFEIAAM